MATRYTGVVLEELTGSEYQVANAVITDVRVSVDWHQEGDLGGLIATATKKGLLYEGTFDYRENRYSPGTTTLRLYRAKDGAVILIGTWDQPSHGTHGRWLFHLFPATEE